MRVFKCLSKKYLIVFCTLRLSLTLVTQITLIGGQEGEDPCEKLVCKWGGMCQKDGFGLAQCICPTSCPVPSNNTVCTVYGLEFSSTCEMHRFSCGNGVRISVKNQSQCEKQDIPRTEACPTIDELLQFSDRYLEWMYVAKATVDDVSFELDRRITQLSITDKIDVAKWEFKRHDSDKNSQLKDKEIDLIFENMKYEPCGFGFIKSCDLDGRDGVSQEEWIVCFNLAERPLQKL